MRLFLYLLLICLLLPISMTGQTIDYMRGDISFEEALTAHDSSWSRVDEQIYRGTDNGIYWIRLTNTPAVSPLIIQIPESHVTGAKLFSSNGQQIEAVPNTRKITFNITTHQAGAIYYLRTDFQKEAILTLETWSLPEYINHQSSQVVYLGIYYGIAFLVIAINLLAFFIYRRPMYLHYIAMLSSITLGLAAADGYFNQLTDNVLIQIYAEPVFNLGVVLALPILANSYMDLKKHLPKVNGPGIVLVVLCIVLFVGYVITGDFLWSVLFQMGALLLVTLYWFAGLLTFRKSTASKVFTIAYCLICFSCYDFYIARCLGIEFLGLTLDQFRIGAIIEMLVFTFAINQQSKFLLTENSQMRKELQEVMQG